MAAAVTHTDAQEPRGEPMIVKLLDRKAPVTGHGRLKDPCRWRRGMVDQDLQQVAIEAFVDVSIPEGRVTADAGTKATGVHPIHTA